MKGRQNGILETVVIEITGLIIALNELPAVGRNTPIDRDRFKI